MANIVGDIAIAIGADIGPLVRDLGRAQGQVSAFGATAQSSASGGMKAWSLAGTAMGAAAVAAGLGIIALTRNAMDNIDAISKSASALGIHTASLQAMAQVANEAGVETDALIKAMIKMQDSIAGLQNGTQAQVDAFGRLGLSLDTLEGKSADEQFALIAAAIQNVADPAQRTAAALDVFGKAGAALIPMFDGYSAALASATKYQQDFGIAASDTAGKDIEAANDAMGRMAGAAQGLGTALAVALTPLMNEAAKAVTDLLGALNYANKHITEKAIEQTMDGIASSLSDVEQKALLAAVSFQGLADGKISGALQANVISIEAAKTAFEAGGISADKYEAQVLEAIHNIQILMDKAGQLNGLDMSGAIEEVGGLAAALMIAFDAARRLFGALPTSGAGPHHPDEGGSNAPLSPLAPGSSPRPGQKDVDFDFGGGSGGGGGGGTDPLQAKLDALQASLQSEAELELAAYEAQQETLQAALDRKLISLEQYQADAEALQAQHQDRMAEIDVGAYGDSQQQIAGYFGIMADALASGNDEMIGLARKFGAAEALINAWRAASQAFADPTVPFYAKFAAAAAALAAGMSMVNAIKSGGSGSVSSGGGSSGGWSSGGGSSGSPAAPLQVAFTGFDPGALYQGSYIESLFNALQAEAGDRGVQVSFPT